MESTMTTSRPPGGTRHARWNTRLVGQIAALLVATVMADTVIMAPLLFLPQMLEHFETDQSAWIASAAMLAAAMWAPLLGRSADIHGKRRMLVIALLIASTGSVVCVFAPDILVFTLGRLAQGAVGASVFLSATIVRELCEPRIAMLAVAIVTTGGAVFNFGSSFLYEILGAEFGFRIVFVAAAVLGAVAAVSIRAVIPRSTRTAGRVDVRGAVLMGAGLAMVLGYISLGSEIGWFGVLPFTLLAAGVTAVVCWVLHSRRIPEPAIDISNLGRPLLLTLLVVVLATGATQSMDQLVSLIAQVTPDQQLGYGLGAQGMLGLLFGLPAVGILVGGVLSGWLATRIGPAATLVATTAVGAVGATGMFAGASWLPAAIAFLFLLQCTMGALLTTGFNMAATLASADRQGAIASMVTTMSAVGSMLITFIGAAVLASTQVVVDGTAVNSATGVYSYIGISVGTFVLAGVLAVRLVRKMSPQLAGPGEQESSPSPTGRHRLVPAGRPSDTAVLTTAGRPGVGHPGPGGARTTAQRFDDPPTVPVMRQV